MNCIRPERQVDHLLLLIGGNAVPNAVAGVLLAKTNGTITLIHSKATLPVARRLVGWFKGKRPDLKVKLLPSDIEESDPASIFQGVTAALKDGKSAGATPKGAQVGLNYTGGTKAMSVHAYMAAKQWAGENATPCQFSYLDARTLSMRFDPLEAASGAGGDEQYVATETELYLKDLLQLHGWVANNTPTTEPMLVRSAGALVRVNQDRDATDAWVAWKDKHFLPLCCIKVGTRRWKDARALGQTILRLPQDQRLSDLVSALQADLSLTDFNAHLGKVATACGLADPTWIAAWLDGTWLEHHVLAQLKELSKPDYNLELQGCVQNVKARPPVVPAVDFELDVLALRGYQLFAFSCGTDRKRNALKFKLFEAFVRARQLGGDEARVALVCTSDRPEALEREMRRDLDVGGQIRVFGTRDLPDLRAHLGKWIKEQSRQ
jgi:hypothetical protein